jgi:hypothetical protein
MASPHSTQCQPVTGSRLGELPASSNLIVTIRP